MKTSDALAIIDIVLLASGIVPQVAARIESLIDRIQSGKDVSLEDLDELLERIDARSNRIQNS